MSKWLLAAITGCLVALSGNGQAAEPQVLALIETVKPAALNCDDESCRVELSSFCLQRDRRAPLHGTPYRVAEGGAFDLVLTGDDGAQRRIKAVKHISLSSVRGFTAVTATLPRETLAALGAASAAIDVGQNVSLLPAGPTISSDFAEDDDTKLATGHFRTVGQQAIEASGAPIASIRALNALVNYVPNTDLARIASHEDLWRVAVMAEMGDVDPAELAQGRAALDDCAASFMSLGGVGLQRCLQIRHDAMLEKLTHTFWQVLGAGS